jgi:hypothetical protein
MALTPTRLPNTHQSFRNPFALAAMQMCLLLWSNPAPSISAATVGVVANVHWGKHLSIWLLLVGEKML